MRDSTAPGVYGLRLTGLDAGSILAEVDAGSPALEISVERGRASDRTERFGPDSAEISLIEDGWVSLERSGMAHFVLANEVPPEELVHPWLVPAAAVFSRWLGRQVLHGGVIARNGKAVAVLGHKEAGKSSLLARLATAGTVEVMADDLVIAQDGTVFAGPRCIDLRPGSTEAVAGADPERIVRDGSRLRLDLPPCTPSARLAGIVTLGWSDGPDVLLERHSTFEGLTSLIPHTVVEADGSVGLLEFLDLPLWQLTRPKQWAAMPEAIDRLTELLS